MHQQVGTVTVSALDGLDVDALDLHMRSIGVPRRGHLCAEMISGGRSNLTFVVYDDASRWVLRRPPLHGLTPSAHDMGREYRVVAALANTDVPVAKAICQSDDTAVLGAPFQMVEYVTGRTIRSATELEALGDSTRIDSCANALIDVLSRLHAVDPTSVGLADFGRSNGYLERQVKRWASQWQHVRQIGDPRDADVERLVVDLGGALPTEGSSSIVHGDYRIDNVILDAADPQHVHAVVDWELSTLGDPLSDVALMCVYREPALNLILGVDAAWTSSLLPPPEEFAHRYSVVSGRPLKHWGFYLGLAFLKLAVIAAGIDFRRRMTLVETSGPQHDSDDHVDQVGAAVAPLIASGLDLLNRN